MSWRKNVWKYLVDFHTWNRIALLQKLYSVTMTYFWKVKDINISEMVGADMKMYGSIL